MNFLIYVLDQLTPYWGQVIETRAHESAHEIDGLLHHEADVHPRRQATDNADYTDNVFAIASLLSIFCALRIKSRVGRVPASGQPTSNFPDSPPPFNVVASTNSASSASASRLGRP